MAASAFPALIMRVLDQYVPSASEAPEKAQVLVSAAWLAAAPSPSIAAAMANASAATTLRNC